MQSNKKIHIGHHLYLVVTLEQRDTDDFLLLYTGVI